MARSLTRPGRVSHYTSARTGSTKLRRPFRIRILSLVLRQESPASLADYASVSIAFEVRRVVDVTSSDEDPTRFVLAERAVEPWLKDYDAHGGGPLDWPSQFDVSAWGFFLARAGGRPVGAAACVFRAPDVTTLRGQDDVALVWDIRVAPEARGRGIGRLLIDAVERWAIDRGARWLEVETQDINVPACRFYERHGFGLRHVNPGAYPELPAETQLLWYKPLTERATERRSSRSA